MSSGYLGRRIQISPGGTEIVQQAREGCGEAGASDIDYRGDAAWR